MSEETYLGDGVFVSHDAGRDDHYVTLRTADGTVIVLGSAALAAFAGYVGNLLDDYGVPDEPDDDEDDDA